MTNAGAVVVRDTTSAMNNSKKISVCYQRWTSKFLIYLAGREISERAGQAKDAVVNTAENATDKLGKGARDVKNTVTDAAGNTADKLKKGAYDVHDNVTHAAGNAKEGLERGANNVKYAVTDTAGTAKKKVETGVENIKDGIGNSKLLLIFNSIQTHSFVV